MLSPSPKAALKKFTIEHTLRLLDLFLVLDLVSAELPRFFCDVEFLAQAAWCGCGTKYIVQVLGNAGCLLFYIVVPAKLRNAKNLVAHLRMMLISGSLVTVSLTPLCS